MTVVAPNPSRMALPPRGGWVRHLLFFCYPVSGNGVWQRNLDQLLQRIDLFNGRRVVAIARQEGEVHPPFGKAPHRVDPPDAVKEYLAGYGCEFIDVENVTTAGESVAFGPLWRAVERYTGWGDVSLYGHAKGVSYPPVHHVHDWARLLYDTNLDHWSLVERAFLTSRHIVGTLRRVPPGPRSRWHFSGTMWWMRNRAVFCREWDKCPLRWGGLEIWPSRVFTVDQSACLFHDEPIDRTAYDPDWLRTVVEKFGRWSEVQKNVAP
jgi:hypothetical protein